MGAEFVIISTPTDYDLVTNTLSTVITDLSIHDVIIINHHSTSRLVLHFGFELNKLKPERPRLIKAYFKSRILMRRQGPARQPVHSPHRCGRKNQIEHGSSALIPRSLKIRCSCSSDKKHSTRNHQAVCQHLTSHARGLFQ